jgi:deoxyinosine 3'endonuclease (endonuclease V)
MVMMLGGSSGHPQNMETGGRPDFGVCAAMDVNYLSTGGARTAAVLAADVSFAHVLAERAVVAPQMAPYRPGGSTCANSRRCARSWTA